MILKFSMRTTARAVILCLCLLACARARAATGGSISGTVTDQTGAVIAGAGAALVNLDLATGYKTTTNAQGFYSFPTLPVGRYELTIEAEGFKTQKKTGLVVDTDAAVRVDAVLEVGERSETVTVSATVAETQVQVETVATHLGEVVSNTQMTALPLNGRSYTDLLPIQPGVIPITTLKSNSVIMAGVTGAISPSGDLNPGNMSIDGQRESSNGFMVNGIDVQEHMNGGTSIVPNLDSIDEFRVLTNNFDPEYGNYNGGMINVISKSGSDAFHGNAFEFLRNTILDAKNYFADSRAVFRQNQFGGTLGGPVRRQKVFFFGDYQGTRTNQGVTTPRISVPSLQDRTGNLSDVPLTRSVSGPYLANLLTQKLGYPVTQGESYSSVFPGGVIPMSAWSAPAKQLLQYIPSPNINGENLFSTSASAKTVRDDKLSGRIDANSRWGQLSAYYFFDDYRLDDPYPGQQGGASVPGFDALTIGRAQMVSLSDTKVFWGNTVNEFHAGFIRNANNIGEPHGGLGVTLASQGFETAPGTPEGIFVQAPQFEGVENMSFNAFVMGVTITNTDQKNNTLYLGDTVSKEFGRHTIKFGAQFHTDQVNEHPNATFNGTFNFHGTETGSDFADFLLGVPSNFTQSSGAPFYLRNKYAGFFMQDSLRARSDLTLNFGVRWDLIMPWWEKYNQLQTVVPGMQSVLYPGAPSGFVVAGDPGIPSTLSPSKFHNFAPRIGVAYSPRFEHGFLRLVFGEGGKSSIRASYGMFYTAFPGLSAGIMYAVPPFGYNYLSPEPPLFATPFINAGDGTNNGQRFPFPFPPHNVSAKNPDASTDWSNFVPISADPYFYYRNDVPYTENYMLSFQRQITKTVLLTMSYVGNQGHHILVLVPANTGDPQLCLSLPGCGPFGEDGTYTNASDEVVHGTRGPLGSNFGAMTAQRTIGNSNYNALETNLRYAGQRTNLLLSYTYGKSIDQASNIGEQINPVDPRLSRAISSFDLRHNFVASYKYELPFDRLFRHSNRLTEGWSISGTTRFSTGFPVTLYDNSDNSLLGTLGNGVNNDLLDTPRFTPGSLQINTNPRNGRPAFNTALFSTEQPGQLGNARRRFFYGPGINNFDMQLTKTVRLTESKSLDLRIEGFNVFNHAQFYGPASVDGEVNNTATFGHIVSAADPRLVQLAAKFSF